MINGDSLEFDMVTQRDLARQIHNQYSTRVASIYDRILRHHKITVKKSDTMWNIILNDPACSILGAPAALRKHSYPHQTDSKKFYEPNIMKVDGTSEGIPDQSTLKEYGLTNNGKRLESILLLTPVINTAQLFLT